MRLVGVKSVPFLARRGVLRFHRGTPPSRPPSRPPKSGPRAGGRSYRRCHAGHPVPRDRRRELAASCSRSRWLRATSIRACGNAPDTRDSFVKLGSERPFYTPVSRGTQIESSFAHVYDTGGMRRTHLRGHANILKRLLIHAGGFNLGVVMRHLIGNGTPRGMQDRLVTVLAPLFVFLLALRGQRAVIGASRGFIEAVRDRFPTTFHVNSSATATCTPAVDPRGPSRVLKK